jgi:hypothetical protein
MNTHYTYVRTGQGTEAEGPREAQRRGHHTYTHTYIQAEGQKQKGLVKLSEEALQKQKPKDVKYEITLIEVSDKYVCMYPCLCVCTNMKTCTR